MKAQVKRLGEIKTIFEIWKSLFRLKVAKRVMTKIFGKSGGVKSGHHYNLENNI